jgi:hypothetical protein
MEIDDRLLVCLPFYRRKLLRDKPWLASTLDDEPARAALLMALEAAGDAKRLKMPDGTERLVPTEGYLRFFRSNH